MRTENFKNKKWGIFTHFVYLDQNNPGRACNLGLGVTDWNECVDDFDVKKYVEQIVQTKAGYVFFTVMQGMQYMCAPNNTFNEITGYKSGEACSNRDLISDIYDELQKHSIDLYLYFTGDGPFRDKLAGEKFGFAESRRNISEEFVIKWAKVLEEYTIRYGDKVKGWWIDGCYSKIDAGGSPSFGYTENLLKYYREAVLKGNPNAIIALNNGVEDNAREYSTYDDFTSGEMFDFIDIPKQQFVGKSQWHALIPLGNTSELDRGTWCSRGLKRDDAYINNYLKEVTDKGGVVSIDVFLGRDGGLDEEQLEVLKKINV